MCLGLAPAVFDLDDNGLVVLLTDEVTDAATASQVRSAAAALPPSGDLDGGVTG